MVGRLVIDNVRPRTLTGAFPAKAVQHAQVPVHAWIHRDGHDLLCARVAWRPVGVRVVGTASGDGGVHEAHTASNDVDGAAVASGAWRYETLVDGGNDEWSGCFTPRAVGLHEFRVEAWASHFGTWARDLRARLGAGDDVEVELLAGAEIVERALAWSADSFDAAQLSRLEATAATLRRTSCTQQARVDAGLDPVVADLLCRVPDPWDRGASEILQCWVDRPLAGSSAWYELFPRSEGGFEGARRRLGPIAEMGFDIVYLPPVHPVGTTARKGRDNALVAGPGDPGSPWAIGSPAGGHDAIDSGLGTLEDFDRFVADAARHGLEVALDFALQCSPDHPWVREHPEWFVHRPDGTIRFAENPPKKYQDIYPLNFWPAGPDGAPDDHARQALWEACRDVLRAWIARGVRIFRVDNPHTKPIAFWAWLLAELRASDPDVLFLAEAFTTPKVMAKLGEVGFSQSYTYFTWRHTAGELRGYVEELAASPSADQLRPNFWPTTPDILSGVLRDGPPAAFSLRAVLAALLVPSWGIYSGYELCENRPASPDNEEHLHSEKYELRTRHWSDPTSLAPLLSRLNQIRRAHPSCAELRTVRFHGADDDALLVFSRTTAEGADPLLVIVNLDPWQVRSATLHLDLSAMGLPADRDLVAHDELSDQTFTWHGPNPWVRLDPARQVAHVVSLVPR